MEDVHDFDEENDTELSYNNSLEMDKMSEVLNEFYDDLYSKTNYVLITLYVPVIVLAVTANILVIVVVLKYHYMRSVTNYFLVNLSVADLLVTMICMPMAVSQAVTMIWVYGEIMCKLFFYLQGVAVAASVFTITAMSIDRYLAIRSPIAFRRVFNRRSTLLVIAALWLIALSIFAPVLRAVTLSPMIELDNITLAGQHIEHPDFHVCSEDFKPVGIHAHIFGTACFVLVYAVPGFIVILAYSMMGRTLCARKPPFDCDSIEGSASSQQGFRLVRERRRVAWILLLLAVLFALCWLPYNVLRLLIDLGVLGDGRTISDVLSYCLFLGHANSALNPIVYCFMTRNFRRSVSEILFRSRHALTRRKPHRKTTGTAAGIRRGCSGCNAAEPGVPSAVLTSRKAPDSLPRTSPKRILQADGRSSNGSEDSNNCNHNSQHQRRSYCLIRTTFGHDQRKTLRRNIEPDETIHRSVNGSRAFRSPLQSPTYTRVVYRGTQRSLSVGGNQPLTHSHPTIPNGVGQTSLTNGPHRSLPTDSSQRVSFDEKTLKT